jgi:hypothetical protein
LPGFASLVFADDPAAAVPAPLLHSAARSAADGSFSREAGAAEETKPGGSGRDRPLAQKSSAGRPWFSANVDPSARIAKLVGAESSPAEIEEPPATPTESSGDNDGPGETKLSLSGFGALGPNTAVSVDRSEGESAAGAGVGARVGASVTARVEARVEMGA